ncbi:hypothetical protein AGLY_010767 [Aphis glycines]|uniref:Uncharacterized protein n=1 Tax=Aphis glycines TaxID=307491 RepID=A0A6G0TFE0_APHGL|nr:hypothetical protein AGLY_010767 [Aphis glycines]
MVFKLHQDECNIDNVMMRVKNETLHVSFFNDYWVSVVGCYSQINNLAIFLVKEMKNCWNENYNTVTFIKEPFTKLSRTKLNNKIILWFRLNILKLSNIYEYDNNVIFSIWISSSNFKYILGEFAEPCHILRVYIETLKMDYLEINQYYSHIIGLHFIENLSDINNINKTTCPLSVKHGANEVSEFPKNFSSLVTHITDGKFMLSLVKHKQLICTLAHAKFSKTSLKMII